MDTSFTRLIYDQIEFIEFRQNILFLKQPQHKASIFFELHLDDFLRIRDFTENFSKRVLGNEKLTIYDYEKELGELTRVVKNGGWILDCPGEDDRQASLKQELLERGFEYFYYKSGNGGDVYRYRKQIFKNR